MIGIFVFLIGLIIGSFLNVLIYRLNAPGVPKFWQGRSFCPNCKHQLFWMDNIPLLSFLLLKGRCRYCKKKISWQYPVVEFLTGIAFVSLVLLGKFDLVTTVIICLLIVIFFSDWIYGLIPDEAVVVMILLSILRGLSFLSILSAAAVSGFFLLIFLVSRGKGIGFGDVKYGLAMGLLLGWPKVLLGLYIAFIMGGFVSVVLLVIKRKTLKATIALGPFLVIGTVIAYFYGDKILGLVSKLLL